MVRLGQKGRRGCRGRRESQVIAENREKRDPGARWGHEVNKALQEMSEQLAQWARTVNQALEETSGRQGLEGRSGRRGILEMSGPLVRRENQGRKGSQVRKGFRGYLAPKESQEKQERRAKGVTLAQMVSAAKTASRHTNSLSSRALRERKRSG